jgi:hypothetical protein
MKYLHLSYIYYSNKALSNQRPFHKSGKKSRDQNKESSSNSQTDRRSLARFVESNVYTQVISRGQPGGGSWYPKYLINMDQNTHYYFQNVTKYLGCEQAGRYNPPYSGILMSL